MKLKHQKFRSKQEFKEERETEYKKIKVDRTKVRHDEPYQSTSRDYSRKYSYVEKRTPNIGDQVFFYAFTDSKRDLSILCKGFIIRKPTRDSQVYKVVISSVSNVFYPSKTSIQINSNVLLGKKIPKDPSQISFDMGLFTETLTKQDVSWIELDTISRNRLQKNLQINQNRKSRRDPSHT